MTDLLDDILEPQPVDPTWQPIVVVPLAPADEVVLRGYAERLGVSQPDALLFLLRLEAGDRVGLQKIMSVDYRNAGNGYARTTTYEATCFGCGSKFSVARRPVPGKRSWCTDCKAKGEPAAQRARDYRARKPSE